MKSKEEIFRHLIENIKKTINGDWDTATLNINVANKFSSYKGFYCIGEEKKNLKVSKFDPQIDLDLIDLHNITTLIKPEVEKWNIAIFNVSHKGGYSIEYVWDQDLFDLVYKPKE